MNVTLPIDDLLTMLYSLSRSNQKWIADHLYENLNAAKAKEKPHAMTEKELLEDLTTAMKEVRDIQAGKLKPMTWEEFYDGI